MYLYTIFFHFPLSLSLIFPKDLIHGDFRSSDKLLQRFSCLKLLFPHKENFVSPVEKLWFPHGGTMVSLRGNYSFKPGN